MTKQTKAELEAELKQLLWCQDNVELMFEPANRKPAVNESIERVARINGLSFKEATRVCVSNSFHEHQRQIDRIRGKLADLNKTEPR